MRKLLILSICISLLAICSSCGMDVEQQVANNENEFAVAEQIVQEEHESDSTTERVTQSFDVMSNDSVITSTESDSESNTESVKGEITSKTSTSNTKSVQTESTDGGKAVSIRINTESQNTVSTTNDAVETTNTPNSTTTESYEQRMKAEYDAVVENAISDQPYNDVLKSTVSDDIILWHLDYTMDPWMSNVDTPVSMNNRYKIELIRKIDDQRMYSIQKPESGGLFYSFYVNSGLECTAYITKSLYLTDYNAIKVGSSIDDVIAIEPATQAYINRNRTYDNLSNDGETSGDFEQHIILKDGLLKLTYSRSGDTYKVSKIDFFDNFKESVDYGMGYPCVYDYSILPEDYPV
ncbi:MAG: hypothetical protein K6B38_11350 [Ruminococcus sp.]|nr:hypothetical protein [Ruminococcus sp.]